MNEWSNDWIDWRGGKCPLKATSKIDFQDRQGLIWIGRTADFIVWKWDKGKPESDLMRYQLHKPHRKFAQSTREILDVLKIAQSHSPCDLYKKAVEEAEKLLSDLREIDGVKIK